MVPGGEVLTSDIMGLRDTVQVDELNIRKGFDTSLQQTYSHHLSTEYDRPVIKTFHHSHDLCKCLVQRNGFSEAIIFSRYNLII